MTDMDPIVREALKRSSQMQGAIPQNQKKQSTRQKDTPKISKEKKENKQVICPDNNFDTQEMKKKENTLDILLKNKDQSLIFLLIVLLMNENSDPSLLLALMYLLI